jgi:hypothetical protein
MPGILTTASSMMCPHGGTVTASPSSTSTQAGGAPILTTADTFAIAGCSFTLPGAVPSPCVTVQWVQSAAKSTRGGAPTLTLASVGLCLAATQSPQGPVVIASTQPQVSGL